MDHPPQNLLDFLRTHDELKEELTAEKIIDRGYDFEEISENIVEFKIERHPGLFRTQSLGKGLGEPAFMNEVTKYTVNLKNGELSGEVLSSKLFYNPFFLAQTEIDNLEEGGFFDSNLSQDKSNFNEVIEEVVKMELAYFNESRTNWDVSVPVSDWNEMMGDLERELRDQLKKKLEPID